MVAVHAWQVPIPPPSIPPVPAFDIADLMSEALSGAVLVALGARLAIDRG